MVGAKSVRPPSIDVLGDAPARTRIASQVQVLDDGQHELAGDRVVVPVIGGEHVWGEGGVDRPDTRIIWITWIRRGKQIHHSTSQCLTRLRGELILDHPLHKPVQLKAVWITMGQRVSDCGSYGVTDGVSAPECSSPERFIK